MPTKTQISQHRHALKLLSSRLAPVLEPELRSALEHAADLVERVHACVDQTSGLRDSSLAGNEYIALLQFIVPSELPPPLAVLTANATSA